MNPTTFTRWKSSTTWTDVELWVRRLDRGVDASIAALLFVAPLFLGGRHPVGRFVFVAIALVGCLLLVARQAIRCSGPVRSHPLVWIGLAAIGAVVFQLVPLPIAAIEWLAPAHRYLLGDIAPTQTLSLVPNETAISLAVTIGYVGVLWLVMQRVQTFADVRRLAQLVAIATIFFALLALAQRYTAGGRFLWVYEHPFRTTSDVVKGPLANRNHFASLLAMGAGPLVAWLFASDTVQESKLSQSPLRAWQISQRSLLVVGLFVVFLASVMTASRGGVVVLVAAALVLATLLAARRMLNWHTTATAAAVVALFVTMALVQSSGRVTDRLGDLASGSVDELDSGGRRRAIWSANLAAISHGGPLGTGAGTHRDIHAAYLPGPSLKPFSHAENSYLQVGTELGWVGLTLLALAIVGVVYTAVRALRCCRDRNDFIVVAGFVAVIAVALVHNAFDFTWYIPACMTTVIVSAGCLARIAQLPSKTTEQGSPAAWRYATVICALAMVVCMTTLWPSLSGSAAWDRYLRLTVRSDRLAVQQSRGEFVANPKATAEYRQWLADSMSDELRTLLIADPNDAEAHVRYAEVCLREFERRREVAANRQSLSQIATTCRDVKFASSEDLRAWLGRAFGDGDTRLLLEAQRHAECATRLAPVDATAWLLRAQTAFLDPATAIGVSDFLARAERLAPHDGAILFELGVQRSLVGDSAGALTAWRACFAAQGPYRYRIVDILAGNVPASDFITDFAPDWSTLHKVWEQYVAKGDETQLRELLSYAVAITERSDRASLGTFPVHAWRWLATMYRDLGDDELSLIQLERAMDCDPQQFGVRFDLAQTLMRIGRYGEAEQHYRWCLARRPEVTALRINLETATTARMKQLRDESTREIASELAATPHATR